NKTQRIITHRCLDYLTSGRQAPVPGRESERRVDGRAWELGVGTEDGADHRLVAVIGLGDGDLVRPLGHPRQFRRRRLLLVQHPLKGLDDAVVVVAGQLEAVLAWLQLLVDT